MNEILRTFVFTSIIALPTTFFAVPTIAQTTTTDPAVAAAQNKQAIADAQLKILQDEQASLTGMLPASNATPNSGAYTVTGSAPFPSQKIAYEQLKAIAHDLVRSCNGKASNPDNDNKTTCNLFKNDKGVVMYDSGEINNLLNYNALLASLNLLKSQAIDITASYSNLDQKAKQLEALHAGVEAQKDFAPVLLPGLFLGSLKTVTDIIGMFRTNTSVAYNSYTPDDAALIAVISNDLIAKKIPVYLPAQMPLSLQVDYNSSRFIKVLSKVQTDLSRLQNSIGVDQANLQELSDALGAYITADEASRANKDQYNAETNAKKKAALKAKQAGLNRTTAAEKAYVLALYQDPSAKHFDLAKAIVNKAAIDHLLKSIAVTYAVVSSASTSLATMQNALISVSASGTSPLTAIFRAESLLAKIKSPNVQILSIKTSVLGGAVVARQNLFTGGHLFYTGGAIANFFLFDATGKVLHSGVLISNDKSKNVKY